MLINLYDCISRDLHGYKGKGDKFSDVMLFVISLNKFASCEQKKVDRQWYRSISWRYVIWRTMISSENLSPLHTIVWSNLFFCKQLSLVVNKQDQRTMKMVKKYFWSFSRFRIQGQILTFKVIFLCQKLAESIWFSLKNLKKEYQLLLVTYCDNFDF